MSGRTEKGAKERDAAIFSAINYPRLRISGCTSISRRRDAVAFT
ncbi:hypothetical protein ABID26_002471 [Mesorhizobium shonense]|uniref:Uncharacterized protein n=1 Tax=Mesorhizobium shonense TaxID=1209948 RepID=A0ABV2HR70_9HYPH